MKLLMFGTKEFWYKTFRKTIENVEDSNEEKAIQNSITVFINVEKEDETRDQEVLSKAVGNIKWLAKKNDYKKVVLHSFGHLSDSKSSSEFAQDIIKRIEKKLTSKGLEAITTPFGYFLEFKMHVNGESLAKVWKSI